MVRYRWEDLPDEARTHIEAYFGPVRGAVSAGPGLTPGVAAHLSTERGGVFLKAIPSRSPALRHYERELAVNNALPHDVPAPRLLRSGYAAEWLLLVFQHIPDAREADLSRGSPDVATVLDTVACLGETLASCPWPDAPGIEEKIGAMRQRAESAITGGRGAEALHGLDLDDLSGSALLHADLHRGNLLVADGRMYVVDWSLACRGAAWVDLALLVPRLVAAGHTPQQAEALVGRVPTWKTAPSAAVTGLAAVRAGFCEYMACHGPDHLRPRRERTAAACRAWLDHRMP
jgi:hypothetical protein